MARTRRLKKVTFMSRGKRIYFLAKRGASAAYQRGKPVAKRGASIAYQQGRKAAQSGKAHAKAYMVRQKSLKHKLNRTAPKGYSNAKYGAPRGKCYACATCGQRFINYKTAKAHVTRSNHAYIQLVRI